MANGNQIERERKERSLVDLGCGGIYSRGFGAIIFLATYGLSFSQRFIRGVDAGGQYFSILDSIRLNFDSILSNSDSISPNLDSIANKWKKAA
ncbi:hypothetical protein GPDM_06128 [Planococcus donghaensis MPA1U2]|uniref:Uncharacterized protein n=1 Tax=Planococcus donghaensis MPA1U2 TaxID=933115 RepID=E7RFI2_9BACL|nr:hypothetical protein [Planococcus donghaensis]EGA90269.1 hypothetical protein GPDM_06128 [Planococcus donghaensis MPA1U2]